MTACGKKSAYSAWSAVKQSVLQLNLRSPPNDQLRHRRALILAHLKLQGQSLVLTPVASSGWFGDVFISSKFSGLSLSDSAVTIDLVLRWGM